MATIQNISSCNDCSLKASCFGHTYDSKDCIETLKYYECVQCGYCCTIRPCPFGSWNEERKCCNELAHDNKCGIYDEIIKDPTSIYSPAFGMGCSGTIGNARRKKKLAERTNKT